MFETAIRERVAALHGEDVENSLIRCPGDGCEIWESTAGTPQEAREAACLDCKRCKGNPPLLTGSNSPEEIKKRVIVRTESLIRQQNAGTLDLTQLDYLEWRLIEVYREAEREQERIHRLRIRGLFESFTK